VLHRAKRLAVARGTTLSAVVADALSAHLQAQSARAPDKPFELIERGRAGAHFPTLAEIEAVEDQEDGAALRVPGVRARAAP